MALRFGSDESGPFVVLGCDMAGCGCHVSLRPVDDSDGLETAVDLAEAAHGFADEDGWWLIGSSYCPTHTLAGFALMGLAVELGPPETAQDGPSGPERPRQAVQPEAAAAAAQRGLTAVH